MSFEKLPELTEHERKAFSRFCSIVQDDEESKNTAICVMRSMLDGEPVAVVAIDHGFGENPIGVMEPVAIMISPDMMKRLFNPFEAPDDADDDGQLELELGL